MAETNGHTVFAEPERKELPRVLGLVDVVGIVIGSVIGSGIFIVPAAIAAQVKSPLLIFAVWMVGGGLSFFGALSFAELGAAFPQAGGMYVYLREAYGPLVSFLFGWTLFLVIDSGTVATLAVAFSAKYLPYFLPLTKLESKLIAVALIAFLAAVNYVGVRWGALLQNLLTLIKVAAVIGISAVVFLLARGNPAHFVSPSPPSFSWSLVGAFGVALVASLWAYKGWEAVTFSAGEIRNPQRILPLGLLVGTALIVTLYIVANLAYLYVLPAAAIARSERIATDVMRIAIGPLGASIVALVILLSIAGAANGNVLTSPRVYYAMARDRLFFRRVADVHPRFLTPHFAILAMGVWSAVLSASGTFEQLFTYVVFGQWIFFGLTVGAVLILRKKRPGIVRPYRTWGYPWTPIIFILSALFISLSSLMNQFRNALAGLVIILLGIPAYFFWKKKTGS
jgi:basic amino acid/polyamine antiporter, APA family